MLIFVLNLGSTSTKLSLYDRKNEISSVTIPHSGEAISKFQRISDQLDFRCEVISNWLTTKGYDVDDLSIIISRSGIVKAVTGGAYSVNEQMLDDLRSAKYGDHACNLGAQVAKRLVGARNIPCIIADPVTTDEFQEVSRLSGHPLLPRKSVFHALNHKAVAKRVAYMLGKEYTDANFVVAHLGGGISVAAHAKGRVIDANNGLDGEGPYSPERAGTLPRKQLIELCFSGKYTLGELRKMINGNGGLMAYLGTNDAMVIEEAIRAGDEDSILYFEGMCYQIAKEIGTYATVLRGQVDAIILTGGLAYSKYLVNYVTEYVSFLAPVYVEAGSDENLALAEIAYDVLSGKLSAQSYI